MHPKAMRSYIVSLGHDTGNQQVILEALRRSGSSWYEQLAAIAPLSAEDISSPMHPSVFQNVMGGALYHQIGEEGLARDHRVKDSYLAAFTQPGHSPAESPFVLNMLTVYESAENASEGFETHSDQANYAAWRSDSWPPGVHPGMTTVDLGPASPGGIGTRSISFPAATTFEGAAAQEQVVVFQVDNVISLVAASDALPVDIESIAQAHAERIAEAIHTVTGD